METRGIWLNQPPSERSGFSARLQVLQYIFLFLNI